MGFGLIMLFAFVLLSLINIWAASSRAISLFRITKPLLMLLLTGFYVTGSISVLPSVVLALLFAWMGDILLLGPDILNEKSGSPRKAGVIIAVAGIAFILCHLSYSLVFFQFSSFLWQWGVAEIAALVYTLIGVILYISLMKGFAESSCIIKVGIGAYAVIILFMSYCSLFVINMNNLYTWLPWVGSCLFVLSDYLLALGYQKDNRSYQAWVMTSYLSAQFLIIIGLSQGFIPWL